MNLVDRVFAEDGVLSKYFPSYSPRKPQIEMAENVCRCLLEGTNGLIEAGTGTGKSLGYAIAAALWSAINQKKVVLSTYTVTLQNQLMEKDLPLVRKVLQDLGYEINFQAGKGRSHYICKRRFFEALAAPQMIEHPQYSILNRLAGELGELERGDRTEIDFDIPGELWREIQGDSNDCLAAESPHYDTCFIQQARARLQAADIVVTNHALFFADLQLKNKGAYGLLPEYDAVIFDEGHRIEDVFSKYFQKVASVREIENLFDRCLQKRSQWAQDAVKEEFEGELVQLKMKALKTAHSVFSQLTQRMKSLGSHSELLKAPLLETNPFVKVLTQYRDAVVNQLGSREWGKGTSRGLENMIATIERTIENFEDLIFNRDSKRWANWIDTVPSRQKPGLVEVSDAYETVISGAPIEPNTVLTELLFSKKPCILTSATLTTAGNFNFMANRLGMKKFIGFQVSSPFDYKNQSVLIVPKGGPAPKDEAAYNDYCVEKIKETLTITGGRTFLLFTSFTHMKNLKEMLDPWLAEQGITPLLHAPSVDREQLLSEFKSLEKAVLFGAESFWEGVDVPGDDLICVVIVRLPFAVPTEALVSARCQKIDDDGGSSFESFMLPNCILRMKQGVGRLLPDGDGPRRGDCPG